MNLVEIGEENVIGIQVSNCYGPYGVDPTGSGARFGDRFGGTDCGFFGLDFRWDILLWGEKSEETLFARITQVELFRMVS